MPLSEPESIDAIRFDPLSGECVLTLRDDWDWEYRRVHVKALLTKLWFYLDYIDRAELLITYPQAIGRELVIEVDPTEPLPGFDGDFIGDLQEICALYGVKLRYRPLDPS